MFKRDAIKLIAVSALSVGATAVLSACSEDKPAFQGVDVTGAKYALDFPLADTDGKPRSVRDFAGKVVIVFFGYAQCPDVCPTTMQELAEIKEALGKDGDKFQGVFITVDPERDTPAVLKAYMENFDPSFIALSGTVAQTEAVAKDYKIYFKKVPGQTETSYTVDHSAGCYIYDTSGRLRVYSRYGSGAKAMLADVKLLLAQR